MTTIILWTLFGILAVLQAADFYTTKRILDRGGYEKAKPMRWLMGKLGASLAMILTKSILLTLAGSLIYFFQDNYLWNLVLIILMIAGITIYIDVGVDNVEVYKEQNRE